MWVFTETGFVSAVRTSPGSDVIRVRSRDSASLQPILELCDVEISRTPHRDYPYRVELSTGDFAKFLTWAVLTMDYTNFKNQVHTTRGYDFAHTLTGVWSIMHEVEDDEARIA